VPLGLDAAKNEERILQILDELPRAVYTHTSPLVCGVTADMSLTSTDTTDNRVMRELKEFAKAWGDVQDLDERFPTLAERYRPYARSGG
jgi:hypothetical protein